MNTKDRAISIAKILAGKKAMDTVIIDIAEKSSFADYMILTTGSSTRLMATLVDEVEEKLEQEGIFVRHIEGKKESGWMLMDYGDIVLSVLTQEMREKYRIETVWGDCQLIELEEEDEREV